MLRALSKKEGFTLVELLIVVAIIGILAAIAIPQFAAYREKAYCSAIKSDLANLAIAEEAYFTDFDRYIIAGAVNSAGLHADLQVQASSNVIMTLGGVDATLDWSATGTHTNCGSGATIYTWDSDAGGSQW